MKLAILFAATLLALTVFMPGASHANSAYMQEFSAAYPSAAGLSCGVCHTKAPALNAYGSDFAGNLNAGVSQALQAIEPMDSDGDGFENGVELNAGTNPSDIASKPGAL